MGTAPAKAGGPEVSEHGSQKHVVSGVVGAGLRRGRQGWGWGGGQGEKRALRAARHYP